MLRTAGLGFLVVLLTVSLDAQAPAPSPATPAANFGKDVLTRKCFQCHQASMWASVRGDRKEWLGVLYRMVGRGALWTEDEINAMAEFLAATRPPLTPNSQAPTPKAN